MPPRERANAGQVGGVAEEVHRHDRARLWRDRSLGKIDIDREGVSVDIHEYGPRAHEEYGVRRRGIGERRDEDLVALADAVGGERDDERGRPRRDGDRVLGSEVFRERFLELGYAWPLREPA